MQAITQSEILLLISEINTFVDNAENLIASASANYEKNKEALLEKNKNALYVLDETYKANCDAVNRKSKQTIGDAKAILQEIDKLDQKLSSVDKYYVKTKKKKEAVLGSATSDKYADSSDYFTTFEQIKSSFNQLYKKYSEDILPGLLNGINFFFSNQRKQDYEELMILRNTVAAFVKEMEEIMLPVTQEHLAALKSQYFAERSKMVEQHKKAQEDFENEYLDALDAVAGRIYEEIDEVLPDEFVEYLYAIMADYGNGFLKVNASSKVQNDVLVMCYFDYPIDFFVQSKAVSDVIKEKCASILVNHAIRLPVIMSVKDAPVWLIENEESNSAAVKSFVQSLMFGILSSCPVARMKFSVVDPENRGNSISSYFDAKKKLPELFGEKIYINKEEVSAKISKLNQTIEHILQDRLGNQYENVFEYAKDRPDYETSVEILMLFDFPRGFTERTLAELRNILRNGSKCGIYTIISYLPDFENNYSMEYKRGIQSIIELTTVIKQNGQSFSYRGLPLLFYRMPERFEFAKFFSKYMLIYESMKNRGISSLPFIKKLLEIKDLKAAKEHIADICDMVVAYERGYARVPAVDTVFQPLITLGSVLYPADVFSDSTAYDALIEKFGVEYRVETENTEFVELPLSFDLRNSFHMLFSSTEADAKGLLAFTHHILWSFLSTMPVSKVNICVFDSEQRGNSIIPFLDFRKKSPDTFDQMIYTNHDAMYRRLSDLNNQIDEFIQNKLGYRYADIFEYNQQTSNQMEPITLLMIYDFPGGMDGRSIDLLMNILRNGSKCGIFAMICKNPAVPYSRYDNMEERMEQIAKYCISVEYREGAYWLLPYNLHISIPQALSGYEIDSFVGNYMETIEAVKNKSLSFEDIIDDRLFSWNSASALRIPVGVGAENSVVDIVLGEGSSHHGLIAGATGSGKSTLLHTIIMSSMLHYSPEQLHLYLMDFKSGTEFKIYESQKLPHIQLLALDAMQEFGESILENLVEEMEHRAKAFKEAGGVTKIKDYVAAAKKPMPRILVIMDEFQILFNDASNRKVAMNCAELTKRIVTEGRAFGIHLLMATQSTKVISELTLSHGTIEQMRIRVGLKCGENDARYLFAENDTKALKMMRGPIGTAVMNPDYTEQPNIGFRTAYCDDETQRKYLEVISKSFEQIPCNLRTFEGSRTTSLIEHFQNEKIGLTNELPVKIHMGTLIKVAPPFSITLDRKRKHNLLVCGSNEKMANTISDNYMISALLNTKMTVYCMDGNLLVGDEDSAEFYELLALNCPGFYFAKSRGDILRFINEAYKEYVSRKKQNSDENILFVIKNLQFLDLVKDMFKGERIDESEFTEEESWETTESAFDPFAAINNMFASRNTDDGLSAGEKFIKMIEDGSGFGIHFVIQSLEYQTVRECMYYGANILAKFPERMIFSLSTNDAGNLIDNVSAAALSDNTVYFTDGVKNTFQMKPYTTPDLDELKQILNTSVPEKVVSQNDQFNQGRVLMFLSRLGE